MNQREIKFRAWDKIRNLMITSKHWSVGFGGEIRPQGREEYNHNEFILMQFTGLKDKNGKEIYEGDIVDILDEGFWEPICTEDEYGLNLCGCTDGIYTRTKVCFDYGSFTFEHEGDDIDMNKWASVGDGTENLHPQERNPNFEIIGNIYENNDLLSSLDTTIKEKNPTTLR